MAAEDIIIRMGMDANAFNRGLQSAKVQAKALNSALGGLGMSIGVASLTAMAAKAVEFGSKISDLSTRLGISTDALQEFDFAAKMSGSSLDEFVGGLQKLAKAQADALGGNEETINSFAALGVSVEDLKTKRIEDIFKQIGRSVRDASDVQLVMADAMKVLGKASGPILAAMRNDLEAAAEEAKRLGLIIGVDTIDKLDALGDSVDTFGKKIMSDLSSPLTWVIDRLNEIIVFSKIAMLTIAGVGTMVVDRVTGGKEKAQATFDAMASEVARIIDEEAARQRPRTRRAPTPIERDNVDAVNSKMVQEVNAVLKLRERIAELQAAELGNVEQRKLIEEQIAKLKLESVNDAVTLAKAAARDKDIAAKEADLKSQKSIEDAAKVIANSNPVDAEGIESKRKAELYLVELTDRRKSIETQITNLKKEGSKANPEEIKSLERQKQMLELKKKQAGLEREQKEFAQQMLEDVNKFTARKAELEGRVAEVESSRADRTKFTLAELAGANLRGISNPKLRADIISAREAARLSGVDGKGGLAEQARMRGDTDEAERLFARADAIKSSLSSLKSSELTSIALDIAKVNKEVHKFNETAANGFKVFPVMGK